MSARHLLDTNIVSYAIRNRASVRERLAELDPAQLVVSVITEAELHYGVARQPEGRYFAEAVREFLPLRSYTHRKTPCSVRKGAR